MNFTNIFGRSRGGGGVQRTVAGVAFFACTVGWAASSSALPPAPSHEVEVSPDAREQFKIGVALLQDPDGARHEEAYKAFERAYEISPSWKILGNLGLCALKLERYSEGIEAYERYLTEGGAHIEGAEKSQIQRDLAVMKSMSGKVTLTAPGGETLQDTRERSVGGAVVNHYQIATSGVLVVRLAAGMHRLTVRGQGQQVALELNVAAGGDVERAVDLTPGAVAPPPAQEQPVAAAPRGMSTLRTTGLVVGGVGVAALIGGGVTAIVGFSKKSDLSERCPNERCVYESTEEQEEFESDKSSLETLGALTTGLLIGGGVLTATGATFFFLGGESAGDEQAPATGVARKATIALSPVFAPGLVGFNARGTF